MKTEFRSDEEIIELVNGFRTQTLPLTRWTHEAHLAVAIWFHKNYSEFEAICYLRSGIITYNHLTGGKNTAEDGYHETITLFWSRVIREFVANHGGLSLVDLCNQFINSPKASRDFLLTFYSKEVLHSTRARAVWVDPDKMPAM